jgi:hypothetical protein
MEFYAAMKKNEILSFTSKWIEMENINLISFKDTFTLTIDTAVSIKTLKELRVSFFFFTSHGDSIGVGSNGPYKYNALSISLINTVPFQVASYLLSYEDHLYPHSTTESR